MTLKKKKSKASNTRKPSHNEVKWLSIFLNLRLLPSIYNTLACKGLLLVC